MRKGLSRCWPFLLPLLVIGAILVSAHEGHGGKEIGPYDLDSPRSISPETAAHIGLKTAEIDFGPLEDTLTLNGIVQADPDRHWTIGTRTAGKILAVYKQTGDKVQRGELLAEIDSPELARNIYEARKLETEYQKLLVEVVRSEGRREQLRIEAKNADEVAQLAESELQRGESVGKEIVSLNVLSERRAAAIRARGEAKLRAIDLEVLDPEIAALKRQADALRLSRDALLAVSNIEQSQQLAATQTASDQSINIVRLLAPADGVVVDRTARPGQWAVAGDVLLEIADFSKVLIEGELPESLISRVASRSSDAVRVRTTADADFVGAGKTKFISPILDQVKRTAHVLIEAPNDQGVLRGGMFVDLAIVLREEETAVVAPVTAVVQDGPVHFVFLKVGDVYRKQDITPGLYNDQFVEILSGLAPGDVVVSQGAYSLTQLRPSAPAAVASATPAKKN
ncbi:MAG: efflux RND transporter periplasmic adaptor subunit [Planctomycetes bacterium]|nr:efflux RND transporter periplasmic adaptor subunit [Planctomycetota bacterium]